MRKNRTYFPTKEKARNKKKWYLLDAAGKTLGRFASEAAKILRGKHKPDFTTHVDTGDGVIIINASQIRVTGNKAAQKVYRRYTGFIGGLRETPYQVMKQKKPEFILYHAIKGMLPKTRLGAHQIKKLRIFCEEKHHLQAQKPIEVNL